MLTTRTNDPTNYPRHLSQPGFLVTNKDRTFICFNPFYESEPSSRPPNYPFGDDRGCGYFFHHDGNGYAIETPPYESFNYLGTDKIQGYFKDKMDQRNCSLSSYNLKDNEEKILKFKCRKRLATKKVGGEPFILYSDDKNTSTYYIESCLKPSFEEAMEVFGRQYEINKKEWESSPLRIIEPVILGALFITLLSTPLLLVWGYYRSVNDYLEKTSSNDVENPSNSKEVASNTDDSKKSDGCFNFLKGKLPFFSEGGDSDSYELKSLIGKNKHSRYDGISQNK